MSDANDKIYNWVCPSYTVEYIDTQYKYSIRNIIYYGFH